MLLPWRSARGPEPPDRFTSELRNVRLCVPAATVITHGASAGEPIVAAPGPSFPAEAETKMPALRASRNASESRSFQGSLEVPPIEKLMTSTPSSVAWLIPARIAVMGHVSMQALYVTRLACGATPERRFSTVRVGPTSRPSTTLPADVDAVWLPWPFVSSGLVPVKSQAPISLSLQKGAPVTGSQTPRYVPRGLAYA